MIAIVDYGAGNLRSIHRAVEAAGAHVDVTGDPERIVAAERVILPGVGNAKASMERLHTDGLADALTEVAGAGKPFLGICLGLQLLFGDVEEGPTHGLDLLAGTVTALPPREKVPHMGWNKATFRDDTALSDAGERYFYFVHSYIAQPANEDDIAAETAYGVTFPSVVIHDNVWGMQFHPEKSGEAGLELVARWTAWNP